MIRDEATAILEKYGFHLRRRNNMFVVKIQCPHGKHHIVGSGEISETVLEAVKLAKLIGIHPNKVSHGKPK
jgi:hypothetical protein